MINLKTAHEIDLMARAGSLLASVLPPLKEACEPGVKTIELDKIADRLIRAGGATPGFLGYHGFPRSICVSINDEAVHGIPGNRNLKAGMTLAIEPTVNAACHEVYMKPDGWTICTADGSLSAYFEHTVAITDRGPLVLTANPMA